MTASDFCTWTSEQTGRSLAIEFEAISFDRSPKIQIDADQRGSLLACELLHPLLVR